MIYQLQKAHPNTLFIVCIRGVTNSIQINKLYSSCIYIKSLFVVSYRSGFSKVFSPIERRRPVRAFAYKFNLENTVLTGELDISEY